MIRTLAVIMTVGGLALSSAAYADTLKGDARQVTPVTYSGNGTETSEVVIVNPRNRVVPGNYFYAPKPPRIWVSMGF